MLMYFKGESMDKYTKFILTIIAVGVLGLNYHLIKDDIFSPAHAVVQFIKFQFAMRMDMVVQKLKEGF